MQDETVKRARELRRDGSRAEKICWELLRDRRIGCVKFRRQHPIGPYFADFACVPRDRERNFHPLTQPLPQRGRGA